jgi:aspartate racemase
VSPRTSAAHIGIVACSAEGAALCYRTICLEAIPRMGEHDHPRITLSGIPMARHMECIARDDWKGVAALLLDGAREVARAGAAFAICPDNTLHQALPDVLPESPVPWLSIADVVADEAARQGFRRLGVLGTKYLMEGPVYRDALEPRGIEMRIPLPDARARINRAIFGELVNAVFEEGTRRMFSDEIAALREEGCDAAVLGCTEIPLIVRPEESCLPTLDSTRLLARAALERALNVGGAGAPPPAA